MRHLIAELAYLWSFLNQYMYSYDLKKKRKDKYMVFIFLFCYLFLFLICLFYNLLKILIFFSQPEVEDDTDQ